ncbi:MAG: hypothetical protein OEL76_13825 [Siculibacillus sp.]|nr:hypothetical protein [Siculibacillus sp.]
MIFHPPILALITAAMIAAVVLAGSGVFALRLLAHWDLDSGAERQIGLERATTLVSTVVAFVLVLEAASLVLFAFNADRMAPLFVGAMCAVGTLNASIYGFPTLWAKIVVFFAAFAWLALDRVDGRTRDYALIRVKYAGLLVLAPLVFIEGALELAYFLDLKADTITSCCGKLFGEDKPALGGDLASLDPFLAMGLVAGGLVVAIGLGFLVGRGRFFALAHGLASVAVFGLALAAIVAAIAPYVYEQPHHHCPFCILKREYGHFGFALYLPLFLATGAGISSAVLASVAPTSARAVAEVATRRLGRLAIGGHVVFALVALAAVLTSRLTLVS